MDSKIYKGGTPIVKYMWCEGDHAEYGPPFSNSYYAGTPPYNSHADGAYGLGYFTLGMPIRPKDIAYQYKALESANLAVGDIIQCIWIPADHYATYLNFKIVEEDSRLAGATVTPTVQDVTKDSAGNYVYTETTDIDYALAAQGLPATIALDTTSNTFISLNQVYSSGLLTVTGTADGSGNVTGTASGVAGYTKPLYSTEDRIKMIGLRIESLPTDTNIKIHNALNGWYLSVKIEGFECPTYL